MLKNEMVLVFLLLSHVTKKCTANLEPLISNFICQVGGNQATQMNNIDDCKDKAKTGSLGA